LTFNNGQTLQWGILNCYKGNFVSIHQPQLELYAFKCYFINTSPLPIWGRHKGMCKIMVHGIQCTFDLHLNWIILQVDVPYVFNLMWKEVMFQKLCATRGDIFQFIPFFTHFMHLSHCFIIIMIIVMAIYLV
jgi:hypothetical protein